MVPLSEPLVKCDFTWVSPRSSLSTLCGPLTGCNRLPVPPSVRISQGPWWQRLSPFWWLTPGSFECMHPIRSFCDPWSCRIKVEELKVEVRRQILHVRPRTVAPFFSTGRREQFCAWSGNGDTLCTCYSWRLVPLLWWRVAGNKIASTRLLFGIGLKKPLPSLVLWLSIK